MNDILFDLAGKAYDTLLSAYKTGDSAGMPTEMREAMELLGQVLI